MNARGISVRRGQFHLAIDAFDAGTNGTALLGRNGAGKSTLLLVLQGLIPYDGVVDRPKRCAGVFAQPAVLRGSVLWNVAAIARAVIGLDERTARKRAKKLLSRVALGDALDLDARRLSSGQRQRLALARALAIEPQALFLDEPFATVDADGRPALRQLVGDYLAESRCTLVLATQNLIDVATLCKKAMVLENGRSVQTLDTGDIDTSQNRYLEALVAESRLVR
ncbi:MAG: ATP-binding cassette domain-containing protein [Candidatus Velthaea sp.]|jgi:ABC-type multidrug transport system ATPase subunit